MDLKRLWLSSDEVTLLPGAMVSGDVVMGAGCSVWYHGVIRGDTSPIRIGNNTNVQDNCTLHSSPDYPLTIGSGVSVGHNAILHGCTIGDDTLIGMGAIVLDGAVVGSNCLVGAGALVTGGTVIPDGWMALGSPAKAVRPLRPDEVEHIRENAREYVELKEKYR